VLDAAIGALATVLRDQAAAPAAIADDRRPSDAQLSSLVVRPWLKRLVRDLSSRHPVVGRLRVAAWRWSERARARRE
jgi:hypothetical protein